MLKTMALIRRTPQMYHFVQWVLACTICIRCEGHSENMESEEKSSAPIYGLQGAKPKDKNIGTGHTIFAFSDCVHLFRFAITRICGFVWENMTMYILSDFVC